MDPERMPHETLAYARAFFTHPRQRLVLSKDLPSFLWTSGQWMWTFGHWPDVLYLRFGQRGRRHHLTHPTQMWYNYI